MQLHTVASPTRRSSDLDAESETLVNEALGKLFAGNMTTISIAHRLSTIEKADLIVVLNAKGEVAETGSYAQLSADRDSEFNKDRKSTRLNSSHIVISYAVTYSR